MAVLLGAAVLAPMSCGGRQLPGCTGSRSCDRLSLPAPVIVAVGAGARFRIDRDGRVQRLPALPLPFPRDAWCCAARDVWSAIRHAHLVIGVGRHVIWRSRLRLASQWQVGVVSVGHGHVVFQAHHKLYLAPLGRPERAVAHREEPLGWTADGLYTYSYAARRLILRSDTGTLLKRISPAPFHGAYPVAEGALYFLFRGWVMEADGTRIEKLSSLRDLGFRSGTFIEPVGSLLELLDNYHLVLLRRDGSVYGRITSRETGEISSPLVAAPRAGAVAFTATSARANGTEDVYLLAPGRRPRDVYAQPIVSAPPDQITHLQWRGKWLLYSDRDQDTLAAVDTKRPGRSIELTGLLRHLLAGRREPAGGFGASWAGEPGGY